MSGWNGGQKITKFMWTNVCVLSSTLTASYFICKLPLIWMQFSKFFLMWVVPKVPWCFTTSAIIKTVVRAKMICLVPDPFTALPKTRLFVSVKTNLGFPDFFLGDVSCVSFTLGSKEGWWQSQINIHLDLHRFKSPQGESISILGIFMFQRKRHNVSEELLSYLLEGCFPDGYLIADTQHLADLLKTGIENTKSESCFLSKNQEPSYTEENPGVQIWIKIKYRNSVLLLEPKCSQSHF